MDTLARRRSLLGIAVTAASAGSFTPSSASASAKPSLRPSHMPLNGSHQNAAQPALHERIAPWQTLPPTPTLPQPEQTRFIESDGAELFWAEYGSGEPVVLLHGGLANSNYWGYQVAELAKHYRVIVMDTRGHGRSTFGNSPFTYGQFALDVVRLLRSRAIATASIVGWSDGGITGLQLAMTAPQVVTRLLTFGANYNRHGLARGGSDAPTFKEFTKRCATEYLAISPNPVKQGQLTAALRAMWANEPNFTMPQLQSISAAAVIADGDHDEIISREHTVALASSIPKAKVIFLPGTSHFGMLQDPGGFLGMISAFIRTSA